MSMEEEDGGKEVSCLSPHPPSIFSEDYILGRFQRESVNVINASSGAAAVLEELDLMPDSRRALLMHKEWPYVKQVYSGGEKVDSGCRGSCEGCPRITNSWALLRSCRGGVRAGRRQARRAQERGSYRMFARQQGACVQGLSSLYDDIPLLASTPKVHMLVREPEFCHYIFVVYSPALCQVEKYKPTQLAQPEEPDDDEYL